MPRYISYIFDADFAKLFAAIQTDGTDLQLYIPYILNNLLNFKDISKWKREQMKREKRKEKANKKIKVNKQITLIIIKRKLS